MESEIAQLKNEIEQLKKVNEQLTSENKELNADVNYWKKVIKEYGAEIKTEMTRLRRRYVPENKNFKQCVIVKIDEDSDIIIIKLSCSDNPRMNDKKDVDGKTIYARNLPNAQYFRYIMYEHICKLLKTSYNGYQYSSFTFHINKTDWNGNRTKLTNDIRNTLNFFICKLEWADDSLYFDNLGKTDYNDETDDNDETDETD